MTETERDPAADGASEGHGTPEADDAAGGEGAAGADAYPDVPDWDDEYVDRVSDRIMFSYDLEKGYARHGETFDLYGRMEMDNHKQFFHPALTYGHYEVTEHLFVRRVDRPAVAEFERLVDYGHELAEEWIDGHEEHYRTDFTFVLVADEASEEVARFVREFSDRNLLKYGMYGHYEIHLCAVVPDEERLVLSENADVGDALAVWRDIESRPGFVERLKRRLLG